MTEAKIGELLGHIGVAISVGQISNLLLTEDQALCWIHEGRYYKKLTPFVDYHHTLLEAFPQQFWDFYRQL